MFFSDDKQLDFQKQFFLPVELDQNHILIKLNNVIDWDKLLSKLSKFFSHSNGRPTSNTRTKVALLIIKHLYQLSDRDLLDHLHQNFYFQFFANVSFRQSKSLIHHSTLTKFRNQIGQEGVRIIEEYFLAIYKKLNPKKFRGKKLITDTTVVPSPIKYPTDINLLESARRKLVKFIDSAKHFSNTSFRTYKRVAKKVFLKYQKLRRTSKKLRKNTQKKLIQFVNRNLNQAEILFNQIKPFLKSYVLKKNKALIDSIKKILQQQKNIYKNIPVKNRIVSLHDTRVRPIVKGKFPIDVEFGPKALLGLKGGFMLLQNLFFDNVSDINLLENSINHFKKAAGDIPSSLAADRGFYSKKNISLAKSLGVKHVAIQNKGSTKQSYCKQSAYKRLIKQRQKIEAKISLAKRKFGLDKIKYTSPHGAEIWTRLSLIGMNLKISCSP